MKKILATNDAPAAIGPYSQGIAAEGKPVFVSGQIPVDPQTGEIVSEDVSEQTARCMNNVRAVLAVAGASLEDVVKTTIFIKNMDDFANINAVYATYFPENPPARACVEVARLPKDVLVEIEAIAMM